MRRLVIFPSIQACVYVSVFAVARSFCYRCIGERARDSSTRVRHLLHHLCSTPRCSSCIFLVYRRASATLLVFFRACGSMHMMSDDYLIPAFISWFLHLCTISRLFPPFISVFCVNTQESNRYLSHRVHRTDVIAAWSGIRPLVRDPKLMDQEGTKVRAFSARGHAHSAACPLVFPSFIFAPPYFLSAFFLSLLLLLSSSLLTM